MSIISDYCLLSHSLLRKMFSFKRIVVTFYYTFTIRNSVPSTSWEELSFLQASRTCYAHYDVFLLFEIHKVILDIYYVEAPNRTTP